MKKIILGLLIAVVLVFILVVLYFTEGSNSKEQNYITHDMVLQQVEELGRLEVVKYNIRDVIEYEKVRNWLPNSKTALIVVGEVVGCVDLTKIEENDIVVVGDSVSLSLPIPEICHFKIDHTRSRVYDIQYGLWDTHSVVDEAYREAEIQLHRQALNMGIIAESRRNTIKILTPLLHVLGFKKIHIDFRDTSGSKLPDEVNMKLQKRK